jgi:hypothetical protein
MKSASRRAGSRNQDTSIGSKTNKRRAGRRTAATAARVTTRAKKTTTRARTKSRAKTASGRKTTGRRAMARAR